MHDLDRVVAERLCHEVTGLCVVFDNEYIEIPRPDLGLTIGWWMHRLMDCPQRRARGCRKRRVQCSFKWMKQQFRRSRSHCGVNAEVRGPAVSHLRLIGFS